MENMGHESKEQVQGRISSGKVNKRSNEVNGELWVAFWNSVIAAALISQRSFDRYDVMFCAHERHYSPNALSAQTISSWTNTDKFTAEISCCCFHSISFKFGCPEVPKPFQMSGTIQRCQTQLGYFPYRLDWFQEK